MTLTPFLTQFGFDADPFESTNADAEPQLAQYFVPPPYFPTVLGDTANPKSHVVLAPRGGGKTAQRRMIENRSAEVGDFLCITFDKFDQPAGFRLDQVTWAYHANQVCRLILVGILVRLDDDPSRVDSLSENQKALLKFQIERFLGSLSAAEFAAAENALKNFGDKARDFFNKYGGPIRVVIQALLSKAGLDKVDVPAELVEEATRDESLRYHFEQLLRVARAIGFKSTYLLVDRVDEMGITGEASNSFAFIRPLLVDLPTLETPGVAFKFFLWDQIATAYAAGGSRPDRVPVYTLSWSLDELKTMLAQRLRAYSGGRVTSFNQLLCAGSGVDVDSLVAYFAAGSPRDMIRLCKRIVAEQTRSSESDTCIGERAVWKGVRMFADERAEELFGQYLGELKRINSPTFTISELSSTVFRISDQAARRKVQLWSETGIVSKIGEVPNPPNRPAYLFGVVDLRVGVAMLPGADVQEFLYDNAFECPSCGAISVTNRDEIVCPKCASQFNASPEVALLGKVSQPPQRKVNESAAQDRLFD